MKTNDILEQKLKEFDEKFTFVARNGKRFFHCQNELIPPEGIPVELKSFLRSFYLAIIEDVEKSLPEKMDIEKSAIL